MSNPNRFHFFHFAPQKLSMERTIIEKTFKNTDKKVLEKRSKYNLPKLLDAIRKVKLDKLSDLMQSLRKMDVLLLIYEYPFISETNETRKKINIILSELYVSTVGRTAWELFQQDIVDPFLYELLHLSYNKQKVGFLGIEQEFLEPFGSAFYSKEGFIKGLAAFLQTSKINSSLILKKWKVKEASILETKILTQMLIKTISDDFVIKRDGENFINSFLSMLPSNEYKRLMKIYLEARNYKQFHHKILEQVIRRLMDPREKMEEWDFLTPQAIEQVKKWLYSLELKKFFDSDINNQRFEYWKRFIDYMENVIPLKSPMVAFIYFSDFVVVEFGKIGAAYFYDREGFEKLILPRTKDFRFINSRSDSYKENQLKDQSVKLNNKSLFITRLIHNKGWERRFDIHMSKYDYLKSPY